MLITLISKRSNAFVSSNFKSINLCITLYKVCARVIVRRLLLIVFCLINPKHEAFVNGCYIIDNVLLIQELMHNSMPPPGGAL